MRSVEVPGGAGVRGAVAKRSDAGDRAVLAEATDIREQGRGRQFLARAIHAAQHCRRSALVALD